MTGEQKNALSRLRDPDRYGLGPAERARLKNVLGWKRTHEETLALAVELLEMGRMHTVVRDELGCSERHFRRLLCEITESRRETPEKCAANPHHSAPVSDTTRKTGRSAWTGVASAPMAGFASFSELDRWLQEHRR